MDTLHTCRKFSRFDHFHLEAKPDDDYTFKPLEKEKVISNKISIFFEQFILGSCGLMKPLNKWILIKKQNKNQSGDNLY